VAVLALALLLALPSGASARVLAPSWIDGTGPSWSNGVVLCVFAPSTPVVAVSAAGLADSGLTVGVASLREETAATTPVAVTPATQVTWTVTNRSSSSWYDLSYNATLPVAPPASAVTSLGKVDVRLDFLLPVRYVEGVTENLSAVTMLLSVSGWPWQSANDHLVIALGLLPAFAGTEHFAPVGTGSTVLASVSNQSGRTLEYFAAGTQGVTQGPSGAGTPVAVQPDWAVGASAASVNLSVGSSAGAFTSLNYSATVGVVLPATIAGLPLSDFILVGGTAALVVVVVGIGVQRVRRRPSDLVFVEEERR